MLVLLGTLALTPTAHGAAPNYVALGDSFSSGTGTRAYFDPACQRSTFAYPELLAATPGFGLPIVNRTCAGEATSDLLAPGDDALAALSVDTALVTLSIGGNDAGYVDVLLQCMRLSTRPCEQRVMQAQTFIRDQLPGLLRTVYTEVRTRAPSARVVIVGYPRLFSDRPCLGAPGIILSERRLLNATADLLGATIASVAAEEEFGYSYVDPIGAFTGHAVCAGSQEWVNGVSNPLTESFHPNRNGHALGYLPLVQATLAG